MQDNGGNSKRFSKVNIELRDKIGHKNPGLFLEKPRSDLTNNVLNSKFQRNKATSSDNSSQISYMDNTNIDTMPPESFGPRYLLTHSLKVTS